MATPIPLSALAQPAVPTLAPSAVSSLAKPASLLGAAPGGAPASAAGLGPGARQASQEVLSQLRDIHGLDPVSWWPPAPGWWLVAMGGLLLLSLGWRYRASLRLRIPPIPVLRIGDWRWDAGRKLRALRQRALTQDPRQTATELSELLRRIAMARLGREACAGLTGADWLAWLTERDPLQFDWRKQGRLLLDAPYAPPASLAPPLSHTPYGPSNGSARGGVATALGEGGSVNRGNTLLPSPLAGEGSGERGSVSRGNTGADWLPLIDAAYQWVLVEDSRRV